MYKVAVCFIWLFVVGVASREMLETPDDAPDSEGVNQLAYCWPFCFYCSLVD